MLLLNSKKNCSGCTACESACPVQAITMQPDQDGFLYPQVNNKKCINCGLCTKVCAYQNEKPAVSYKKVFVAVAHNTDLSKTASGGIFSGIAQSVISAGGIVYGSAMTYSDNQRQVCHTRVDSLSLLEILKGSKYVHSNMQGIYPAVLEDLKKGKTVLFSGTPCQVAGLKGFLQKDYTNLYTIDLICHGVPSEKLFQQYISFEEQKHKSEITAFRFRDKSQGWKLHGTMVLKNGNTVYFEPEESSYYQMFLNSYTYRENCYSCPYASRHRAGDITIGDYWNIDLVHPELLTENGGQIDEHKGVSCTIVNNARGREMLDLFGKNINKWPSSYENASRYNRQLTAPSVLKPERDTVMKLARTDYAKLDRWYRRRLLPIKINRSIRRAIPRSIKNAIKKVLKIIN